MRVLSRKGLSVSSEPSYAVSRSSATSHAPMRTRLPTTPSVRTPRQPGRYAFAQPAHVWPLAGTGISETTNARIAVVISPGVFMSSSRRERATASALAHRDAASDRRAAAHLDPSPLLR
jgi:hypothetical protein